MLQVFASSSRAAVRFGVILVLGASLLTGVMAEASADAGCGENAVMSSCCCGDDIDRCADQGAAACAARCLCGPAHQLGPIAAPALLRALTHVAVAAGDRADPPDYRAPPLTPPPIIHL